METMLVYHLKVTYGQRTFHSISYRSRLTQFEKVKPLQTKRLSWDVIHSFWSYTLMLKTQLYEVRKTSMDPILNMSKPLLRTGSIIVIYCYQPILLYLDYNGCSRLFNSTGVTYYKFILLRTQRSFPPLKQPKNIKCVLKSHVYSTFYFQHYR